MAAGPHVDHQSGTTLPAIDEEEVDVIDLFRAYQESCRLRLEACGDDPGLRLGALEPLVHELLQQNEMLIQSISQLQEQQNHSAIHSDGHVRSKETAGGDQHLLQQVTQIHDSGHVSAVQVIRELNNHLTSLQIENNALRDKNENLEHDIENLLDMIDFERNARTARDGIHDPRNNESQITSRASGDPVLKGTTISCKLLTFCDSLVPEDVYGPIESHSQTYAGNEGLGNDRDDGRVVCEGENESAANAPSPERRENQSLKSLDASSTGKDSGCSSVTETVLQTRDKQKPLTSASSCSLASSNQQLLLEEKDLLITDLQQHLESLTQQVQLSDNVIKKVEVKLTEKRKECNEWRSKAFEWQRKLNHHIKENMELKERILVLNDHKRCLMTRLDAESEACHSAREELVLLRRRSSQLLHQNEFQSMTIEHLKEAIVTKTRALSTLSSASSSPSLAHGLQTNSTIHL